MNTSRLLGRTTAAVGAPEEISVGNGMTLSALVLGLGNITPTTVVSGPSTFSAATDASVGAELITTAADADFSSATGNWSGTGWTVGSGVFTHVAGANAATLAGVAAANGGIYQVTFTINTTTIGSVTVGFGGVTSPAFGTSTGSLTAVVVQLTATGTGGLVITPNATWAGTFDNFSIKQVTTSTPSLTLKSFAGTTGVETRTYGGISFGIGVTALRSGSTANFVTAIGYQALYSNVGGNNTAIGCQAMVSNVTGTNQTALGYSALRYNVWGIGNVAIGANASGSQLSGTNTSVGYQALFSNLSGSQNTAVGYQSQYSSTVGSFNTSVGQSALYTNTGDSNTAVGYNALFSNTSGGQNIAMGRDALQSNTIGVYDTAIGYRSQYVQTTANYNTSLGGLTLNANTTGSFNTAIGYNALGVCKPTSKAISAFADYSATVAGTVKATSVAHGLIGTTSKVISGTTNYNGTFSVTVIDVDNFYFTDTWLGNETTGWWSVASEGTGNTALGFAAGGNITTGYNNTFLGHGTGNAITTGTGNTIVGYYSSALAVALTNNIILASGTAIRAQFDGTDWSITSLTDSSSTVSGSFRLAGGMAVAKTLYVGTGANIKGDTFFYGPTASTLNVYFRADAGSGVQTYWSNGGFTRASINLSTTGNSFYMNSHNATGVFTDTFMSVDTTAATGNIVFTSTRPFSTGPLTSVGRTNTAGEKVKRNPQSIAYTILVTDYYVVYTGTGGHAFTLPSAATATAGKVFLIKHNGSGVLTIQRGGSDTIDGAVSITPAVKQSVMLISDGVSNWEVN
jgi:hypothetical protein